MSWHRMDDDWPDHPRLEHANAGDVAFWQAVIAYSSKNLTDGYVTKSALKRTRFYTWNRTQKLLDIGLLCRTQNGAYQLRDYDHYQSPQATVRAKKEANAERQRKARSRRDSQRDSHSMSQGPPTPIPKENPLTPINGGTENLREGLRGSGTSPREITELAAKNSKRAATLAGCRRLAQTYRDAGEPEPVIREWLENEYRHDPSIVSEAIGGTAA